MNILVDTIVTIAYSYYINNATTQETQMTKLEWIPITVGIVLFAVYLGLTVGLVYAVVL